MPSIGFLVSLVAIVLALVLALRGFSAHQLPSRKVILYAGIWSALFGGLAALIAAFGP